MSKGAPPQYFPLQILDSISEHGLHVSFRNRIQIIDAAESHFLQAYSVRNLSLYA